MADNEWEEIPLDSDEWEEIPLDAPTSAVKPKKASAAQTALESYGNAASMGYLPQLQALATPVTDKIFSLATGKKPEATDYLTERDANIARQKAQGTENPIASGLGTLAGIANTALIGGGAARAAGAGSKAMQAAKAGAVAGAAYNPGDEAGVIAPVQPVQRLAGAAMGGVTGGVMSKVGNAVTRGADLDRTLQRVKSPAGLAREMADFEDDALRQYSEKAIKPQANRLKELLKGKTVEVTPTDIEGVSPRLDKYAKALAKRNLKNNVDNSWSTPVERPANIANLLKKQLAKEANHLKGKTFDPGTAARVPKAEAGAAKLRESINNLDSRVEPINKRLQDMIQTRNAIRSSTDSAPIGTAATSNLDKRSLLADIDNAAGTKLAQRGDDIAKAQDWLGQGGIPGSKHQIIRQALGILPRVGAKVSRVAEPVVKPLTGPEAQLSLIELLSEVKR